jgi:anti-anti-sigma factor
MAAEAESRRIDIIRLTEGETLTHQLLAAHAIAPPRDLLLDLSAVTYLASAHLGQLLTLRKHLHAHDRGLRLFGLQPKVRELFDMTSLHLVLDVFDTEAQAAASLS